MRPSGSALTALSLALAACGGGEAPPLPAEIRAAVAQQLAGAGIDPARQAGAGALYRAVALTAHAAPDWLVDFNAIADGRLCGSGGCPLQVWVKVGATPYRLAFDRQVLAHAVAGDGSGRRWLELDLHGTACGDTGSAACRYYFEWHGKADDAGGHFAPVPVGGRPSRYAGPLVQALPPRPPAGAAAQAAADYRAACATAGGTADVAEALARLPDLTGDDRAEWLFDADMAFCLGDGGQPVAPSCRDAACLTRLFSDHGGRGWRTVWSAAAVAYAVDYRQPRPRLVVRPAECADCVERMLVWHDGEGRLVGEPP